MPNFVTDTLAKVDSTLLSYTATAFSDLAAANAATLRLMLILYVAIFGILVWYGAVRLTMAQVVKHLFTAVVVFVLATSWGAFSAFFYEVFTNGPDALVGAIVAAGSKASASDALGTVFDRGMEAAKNVWDKSGLTDPVPALVGIVVYVGTLLLVGIALFLLVLAKLALAVLLALGPLFVMLYLFQPTRTFFDGWIRQLATFALVPVLTFGILSLMLRIIEPVTAGLVARGASITLIDTAQFLLIGLITAFLFTQVLSIAASLAGGFVLHASGALGLVTSPVRASGREARAFGSDLLNRAAGLRTWQRSVTYRSGAAIGRTAQTLYSRLRRR
ncbi:MAG: type IV secretion system protein [Burkholderiales bacterium]|nr:type IV secretion system protein [Burkholderiales bacterium]